MEPVLYNRQAATLIEQYASFGVKPHSAPIPKHRFTELRRLRVRRCEHRAGLRAARRHRRCGGAGCRRTKRQCERNGQDSCAPRIVWALITSCPEALHLVPGLIACEPMETAPDRSWQRIRHVLDYSWYVPKLTYEFRASYTYPSRVSIERISGDFRVLRGSWDLQSEGDYTVAHYAVELAPGFWVPHWIVRAVLRRDLPKMLRALRARAESVQKRPTE